MAVKARIFSKHTADDPTDVEFAYALSVGDKFVLRSESRGTLVCTVETVTHYPVNAGSGAEPSVAYYVAMTPSSKMRSRWWQAKQMIGEALRQSARLK